jgi:hypothetical protein
MHDVLDFTDSQRDAAARALTTLEQQAKEVIAAIRTAKENAAAAQSRCDAIEASFREAQKAVQAEQAATDALIVGKSAMVASAAQEVRDALPTATADFVELDADVIVAAVRSTDPAAVEAALSSARFDLQTVAKMRDPAHRARVREALSEAHI